MGEKHYPPIFADTKFHCPHCDVFTEHRWSYLDINNNIYKQTEIDSRTKIDGSLPRYYMVSKCMHCNKFIIWIDRKMVYPKVVSVATPNDDMPDEIKKDYSEAAYILNDSPRAAAALLRLALQKLCKFLGEPGANINDDIKSLVKKGLNPLVQQSLDALRITGNNAVHPGEIDLEENSEKVIMLFKLINFICDKMITEPKEIKSFYSSLPEKSLKAIEKRDT